MGEENQDRSNLYLKLFKTVFDSVSTFSAENEHMLRPYLHQIVNKLVLFVQCSIFNNSAYRFLFFFRFST